MTKEFCIVAIFKNESEIFKEWIEHYIKEGCSKFFFIDNGSTDNYVKEIENYKNLIDLVIDDKKHSQGILYNKYFLEKVKSYDWTIVCDLDEFIYSRDQYKTIASFLSSVKDPVSQIAVPWKLFGSNGFNTPDKKEPSSVIHAFTKRLNYDKTNGSTQGVTKTQNGFKMDLCKCIVRSSALEELNIHSNKINQGITTQSTKPHIKCDGGSVVPVNENVLKESFLQLNHYAIRSLDWYTRIKMTRGAADCAAGAVAKSKIGYFYAYDKASNDIDDFELKNKVYN